MSLVAEVLANEDFLVNIVLNWVSDVVESLPERDARTDEKVGKAVFPDVKVDDVDSEVKVEAEIFVG